MFGKIEFEEFKGLTEMPQKAASAWGAVDGIVGASYKPLLFIGEQVARGTTTKHIVTIAINEFGGIYTIVPSSIEVIIA